MTRDFGVENHRKSTGGWYHEIRKVLRMEVTIPPPFSGGTKYPPLEINLSKLLRSDTFLGEGGDREPLLRKGLKWCYPPKNWESYPWLSFSSKRFHTKIQVG